MKSPLHNKRGFAAMDPEKHRAICRKAGASVKPENRTFSRDRELAVAAARSVDPANRSFSRDRALAAKLGAIGGKISKRKATP